jgi:hypothetical protein
MINTSLSSAKILDPNQRIAALEARVAQLERALQVSATGGVTLKSTHSMSIEAGSQLEIRCPGNMKILAGGQLRLKGASIAQN